MATGFFSSVSIQINNLTVAYQGHPAVHHLTAIIEHGEWLAVVGPNGAGKSTLLNTLAGLIKQYEGSVQGLDPSQVAYLPQQTQLDKAFPLTVYELITTGLWSRVGFSGRLTSKHFNLCDEAVNAVGLKGFEDRLISSLSGGQLQRSLFARVMIQDQPIILLDEPFNAIDAKTLSDLTGLIRRWHAKRRTVITVTHDLDYVREHCPSSLLLARECLSHGPTKEVLTEENLNRAKHLLEAFDENAPWCSY